jgi:hypothetical protein
VKSWFANQAGQYSWARNANPSNAVHVPCAAFCWPEYDRLSKQEDTRSQRWQSVPHLDMFSFPKSRIKEVFRDVTKAVFIYLAFGIDKFVDRNAYLVVAIVLPPNTRN